jgi:hypothetical protein
MNREQILRAESILGRARLELGLDLVAGLRGISQSTWRKISERMVPYEAENGRFLLPVASVEFRLSDGASLSDREVRQLLCLCGGFAPLFLLDPES